MGTFVACADKTLSNHSLTFEMIFSAECAFEASVGMQNKRCPVRILKALLNADEARKLDDLPDCFFSEFGVKFKAFVDPYGGFQGRVAYEALLHLAPRLRFTTHRIESLHAALRRLLTMRGVQTHAFSLEVAALEWTISRARRRADFENFTDVLTPPKPRSAPIPALENANEATSDQPKRKKTHGICMCARPRLALRAGPL